MKKSLLISVLFLIGCSTSPSKNSSSRWTTIGTAVPVGIAVGVATTPDDEKEEFHALTWGATFGLAAALVNELFFNDNKQITALQKENENLRNFPKFEIIKKGKGVFKKNGEKVSGVYTVKKIDRWKEITPNKKVHQDMIIEAVENKKGQNEKNE